MGPLTVPWVRLVVPRTALWTGLSLRLAEVMGILAATAAVLADTKGAVHRSRQCDELFCWHSPGQLHHPPLLRLHFKTGHHCAVTAEAWAHTSPGHPSPAALHVQSCWLLGAEQEAAVLGGGRGQRLWEEVCGEAALVLC